MGTITFITGGARSGKSTCALKEARSAGGKTAFVATCEPLDKEMRRRIARHKKTRPASWDTFETFSALSPLLKKIASRYDTIVVDCLTLLISNLMGEGVGQKKIEKEIDTALAVLARAKAHCIIVSNEVGLGIVPRSRLARDFRDAAGRINQKVAAKARRVFFVVCGIPWRIR